MKTNFYNFLNGEGHWARAELARYCQMSEQNFRPIMSRLKNGQGLSVNTRKKLIDGANKAFGSVLAYETVDFNIKK